MAAPSTSPPADPPEDEFSHDELDDPPDPWAAAQRAGGPPGFSAKPSPASAEREEYRLFLEHLRSRNQRRSRQARSDGSDDDHGGGGGGDRSNAGPPPAWDGSTAFKDYAIRVRLWLATTKVKASSRGPLLLKNLTGTPFDDLKHLAKDPQWMTAPDNGEQLLKLMDTKELYGDDRREDMLNSLVKVTYTIRRARGETRKAFFSRWENSVRKLGEHSITLPTEYLGFLLTVALQLSQEEVKLLLNFTQGRLSQKDVKEWVRVHETDLDIRSSSSSTSNARKAIAAVNHIEGDDTILENHDGGDEPDDELEVLMSAMNDLDSGDYGSEDYGEGVFDEEEAREVLATMIKEHAKKRTFTAVNTAKKAKSLARGFGAAARPNSNRDGYSGRGLDRFAGGSYRVSIEALKRRTRCGICKQTGHWHKECPQKGGQSQSNEVHFLGFEEFRAMKKSVIEAASSEKVISSASDRVRDSHSLPTGAYMSAAPECLHEVPFEIVTEAQCATIDTGCQRTAVGLNTLRKFTEAYPEGVEAVYKAEAHNFKSVNGVTSTSQVACLPASLGCHGSILRPAVFDDDKTRDAPFLISLPFLLHCRASIQLDPEEGLCLHLKRFNHRVPLHIGPTGALRVPLQQFQSGKMAGLKEALSHVQHHELEVHSLGARDSRLSLDHKPPCTPPGLDLPDVRQQQARSDRAASSHALPGDMEAHDAQDLHGDHQCRSPSSSQHAVCSRTGRSSVSPGGRYAPAAERERAAVHQRYDRTDAVDARARPDEGRTLGFRRALVPASLTNGDLDINLQLREGGLPRGPAIRCFCGLPTDGYFAAVPAGRSWSSGAVTSSGWSTNRTGILTRRAGSRPIGILPLRHSRDSEGASQPHPNSGRRHRTSCHSWHHRDQWVQVWDQLQGLRTRACGTLEV